MRPSLFALAALGILTVGGSRDAFAQQRQLRPVTITYRSTSVIRTQWPQGTSNQITPAPGDTVSTTTPVSNTVTGRDNAGQGASLMNRKLVNPNPVGFSRGTVADESFNGGAQRPTNQQLQNPSGAFQLSHAGFSQPGSVAPNNYFGPEYNGWNNLRVPSGNLDSFESFNRSQPDMNSGGYYSPNTYLGIANNDWSNLSSGAVSPNELGGWSYQP